jgi:ribosome-associated protein
MPVTPTPPAESDGGAERRLRVNRDLTIPLGEILIRVSRSSGPGGQHANVTASRVEASFDVLTSPSLNESQRARVVARAGPRMVAVAQDERSQARNRELALRRLAERLARALLVPRKRRPTRPTAASRTRRLDAKRRVGQRKLRRRPPAADEG